MKDLLPIMYLRILEQSSSRIQADIVGGFSYFMESYEAAQDKEQVLRNMFITVFAEVSVPPAIEPWTITVGEENIQLFYKYLWVRCKSPEIKDFGRNFFFEVCEPKFQIHLVKQYMKMLNSMYTDLLMIHQSMLSYCISDELEDDKQEALALFESKLIADAEEPILQLPKKEKAEEESKDEVPQIKVSLHDTSMTEDTSCIEKKMSDFLSTRFVEHGPMSVLINLQTHMESLFGGEQQLVRKTIEELPELL